MQKRGRRATVHWRVWVAIELYGSVLRHGSLCYDMVLCVTTRFTGCRGCKVATRGFPSHDRVVFLLVFCRDRGPPCIVTMFCSML